MGNTVAREERALSPLSAWGDRFEEYANGRYEDIATPPPQRAAAAVAKADRSQVSTRRRDSLELARLDAERRTNSALSLQPEGTKKKKKKKKVVAAATPVPLDPSSDLPTTYTLEPYPHDPPIETPVHPDAFGADAPVPGLLPRRKKAVATVQPAAFEGRKPWSAPTLPPPSDEPSEVLLEAVPAAVVAQKQARRPFTEPLPTPLAVPVVQPRRTDAVRVGKILNPPVNPARLISIEQGMRRSSSVPRSTASSEQLMKPPPKRTQSDIGDASGISSTSSSSSTRVVGTKKKRGKAPPKNFKFYACPDNLLRPQTNYSGQPETLTLPVRKANSQ